MKSIVLISKEKEQSNKYIADLCDRERIGKFDMSVITGDTSIGIAEVRKIKETIFLTPSMGNKKAVIIENAGLLTTEAQNALLKTLEEPPNSTFIILLSDTVETFLPTVISRCEVIKIIESKEKLPKNQEKIESDLLKKLTIMLSANINARLKIAQDNGKTKETALLFLEETIKGLEIKLLKHHEINLAEKMLPEGQKSYTQLKTTNTNPRLALEHFLLQSL